ncbi:AAA family ATPase [Reichenbachiella sp.]
MKITVDKFKGIDFGEVELDEITVFVGSNNAGKSSFIQAIQFGVSGCQTLHLNGVPWRDGRTNRTTSFGSEEFLYTPTRFIETLYHGQKLTERTGGIKISFEDENRKSTIEFKKGRNKGISTKLYNSELGDELCDINRPFCVYVPGIAGIPVEETYEPEIKVRKSAVRGDSNNYLRNILLRIKNDEEPQKWISFKTSLDAIYPGVEIEVSYDENASEYIECDINLGATFLPLDSVGTGVLQTMQIFAYMEYFSPQILLLDEPDSHLHPTKQRLLAQEIKRRSEENTEMKVVFSTHSMQLLRALSDSKTYHFIKGAPTLSEKESSVLLDIGALDADYLFSKPHLKYVIITEDQVDNVKEKKNFIKQFLISNGLTENEFVLHSYNGCKNMHTAGVLQGLVQKHIPSAKVIVHIDRDQKWDDDDPDIQILKSKSHTHGVKLFLTGKSEIENYFCTPQHLGEIFEIDSAQAQEILEEAEAELQEITLRKTKDFILNERSSLITDDRNRIKSEELERIASEAVRDHFNRICPGKELISCIKQKLQDRLSLGDTSIIVQPSVGLESADFKKLIDN